MSSLSVVICSYNPNQEVMLKTIAALREQTLPVAEWELIVIDNNSPKPIASWLDLSWHPKAEILVEHQLGLSYARVCGVTNSSAALIVFVDDDNLLDQQYLELALQFHRLHPQVGCYGGKSLPVYESSPPDWFHQTGIKLGCRDLGNELKLSDFTQVNQKLNTYPYYAPIGTGMVILKQAFMGYLNEAKYAEKRLELGRKGEKLTSGEDNDIVLTTIKNGYEIAYVPTLIVHHLIPKNRYTLSYLLKMAYESNRSWVKVLEMHGVNPWKKIPKWTLIPRLAKAYLKHLPYKGALNKINYMAASGKLKGQSEI